MAQAVNYFIDSGVLFYIRVGAGNIRLGLVVIVIGDKIMHRIVGEKFFEFLIELGRECFVVRDDQCGLLYVFNDISNSECLARSSDTKQCLVPYTSIQIARERGNGGRLVAGGGECRYQTERRSVV